MPLTPLVPKPVVGRVKGVPFMIRPQFVSIYINQPAVVCPLPVHYVMSTTMSRFFYVAGYLIEERRRWPVITASPRGQCSK